MYLDRIESRQILPDRIQLCCSIPHLFSYKPDSELDIKLKDYIEDIKPLKSNKNFKKTYRTEKHYLGNGLSEIKRVITLKIPDSYFKDNYSYISNVNFRTERPFTFTLEFNFIRYLKDYAKGTYGFDKAYNDAILIAEDNYIDQRIWSILSSSQEFIKTLINAVPFEVKQFSGDLIKKFIPNFDLKYETLSIKQIELNKDYFVGGNKSAEILHNIQQFLCSYEGIDWLNGMTAYAINSYKADPSKLPTLNAVGDLTSPTLKYYMVDGMKFKIYRKTTDHERLELTIEKNYIQKRFKNQSYEEVMNSSFKVAQDFFDKSNFENIIGTTSTESYNDKLPQFDIIMNFVDIHFPELAYIFDCLRNNVPIRDSRVISWIKQKPSLYSYFTKTFDSSNRKILIYQS